MADATIIVGKLDSKQLETAIDNLVKAVNTKMNDAATAFDSGLQRMETSLQTFAAKSRTTVGEIKEAFKQLGTTFDQFAKAMENAAAAHGGAGAGGTGSGGSGSSGGGTAASGTVGELKQKVELQKKVVDQQVIGNAQTQVEVDHLEKMKGQVKEILKSTEQRVKEESKLALRNATTMRDSDLMSAQAKLAQLQTIQRTYTEKQMGTDNWNRLGRAIDNVTAKIQRLQQTKPTSWNEWAKMTENSIDEVAKKMQALKHIQINPNNAAEVKKLGEEYQRLGRRQAELMGKGVQLTHSNNYLAQSFGYIRNRIVYALTLGAFTNFIKQLYEVRGQYELLERSLGILVDSMERGTQVFNELNEMAIKSPFTLIELGGAAKQLAAYNFTADELVDTTRRLADISSALGVPMERLVYNLGQIKAQGRLNARDARDFANAGLAIVPMLAQLYTETKRFGDQQVTTAQVYDMITKKMVSYNDVLAVLHRATDEGGKFFDFQAKQAGTLRVQIANLSLAFNNMLNDIGTQHQSALSKPLQAMRWIFKNWQGIYKAIQLVIAILGIYKAEAIMTGVAASLLAIKNAWTSITTAIKGAFASQQAFNAAVSANRLTLIASALAALALGYSWFGDKVEESTEEIEKFGESSVKTQNKLNTYYQILQGVDKNSETYKKTLGELNSVLEEYGIRAIKEGENIKTVNKIREQAINLIREESAERQYANQMAAGAERYNKSIEAAQSKLVEDLKNAVTRNILGFTSGNKELQQNADAIAAIVGQIVQENISLIANKTDEEYQKGLDKIFSKIQERMKKIGISEKTISKVWMDNSLFFHGNIVGKYIESIKGAAEANQTFNEKVEKNYQEGIKASGSMMTLTQKIAAYERSLQKPSEDTMKLYTRIADLVRDYAHTHNIDFNVRFKAEVPPAWMNAKELPELQALAKRFAALAANYKEGVKVGSGGKDGIFMSQEELMQRAFLYAEAAKQKEEAAATDAAREAEEEKRRKKEEAARRAEEARARAAANRAHAAQVKQENEVAKALKDEISLVKEMQSNYDKLRKAGIKHTDAINIAAMGYEDTIKRINAVLAKYGIAQFKSENFAGKDVNALLKTLNEQKQTLLRSGKVNNESLKDVDVEIAKLNVEARTINAKKVIDGLNSELGKIKEEYEIGIELDSFPELAGIMADMMGIARDEIINLPKDFESALEKMQGVIDEKLGSGIFDLQENLNKKDFEDWLETHSIAKESDLAKELNSFVEYANKIRKDEAKKTIEGWEKLLEKYAEYEYKRKKIIEDAKRERETAMKHGADRNILSAIDTQESKELAKLDFEEYQKLPTWISATGDLANMSRDAIDILVERLEEYKKSARNLDPKQIQKINRALRQLYKEQRKGNPFAIINNAMDEAKDRMEEYQIAIDKVGDEIEKLQEKEKKDGKLDNEQAKRLTNLKKLFKQLKEEQVKAGEVSATQVVDGINDAIKIASQASSAFNEMAEALGGKGMTKAAKTLQQVTGILEQGGQGAAVGAQIGGGYGAIIGGALGVLQGVVTTFADKWSGNAAITEEIEESEKAVRELELAYKDLKFAIDNSLGAAEIQARRATLENKKLLLQEKERQLALEESRKDKNRDEDAIYSLKSDIADLRNEIVELSSDVANMLLGSDIKSAAEDFVSTWVSAWRQGNDTMDALTGKFDDMIDNMIMKSLASKLVQQRLAPIFAMMDEFTGMETDDQILDKLKDVKSRIENGSFADEINHVLELIYGYLGIKQGSGNNKNLSALQQGIKGITEDTAGALEAYMNGVSQQVYLQSDLLTQIRDAVIAIDADVQTATQAQILLQLQNTYVLMQAMTSMMNGWTLPSGQGIRVELMN